MSDATWRLYRYDTWGNAEEGYWVNDLWRTPDTLDLPDGCGPNELLARMHQADLINDVNAFDVEDSSEDVFVLSSHEDGKPLGEWRKED